MCCTIGGRGPNAACVEKRAATSKLTGVGAIGTVRFVLSGSPGADASPSDTVPVRVLVWDPPVQFDMAMTGPVQGADFDTIDVGDVWPLVNP